MAANPTSPKPALQIETEKSPNQVTLRINGRLVADTSEQFQHAVREQLSNTKVLVLDMTGVSYLDSSALGAVVGLKISAKRAGCQMKLVNLTPRVKELFSLTRLTEILEEHSQEGMLGATPH